METLNTDSNAAETPAQAPAAPRRPLWWRILGLKRREKARFIRYGLTIRGWIVMILLVGGGGMAAFAEYSMQPEFCNSCHIMAPYYRAWHESSHKNVPCTQCHFEPGLEKTLYGKFQASSQAVKYITKTYGSKPHAEIRDSSCMRPECHAQRVNQGKVDWPITTQAGHEVTIKFDHGPHLSLERRGKQLRCVSCHSQIVQGKHIVVTTDTCFLCHFKGLKHGRDDQTIGTCKGCHDAPKGVIRQATGNFSHDEYMKRGVLCENCHSDSVKGDGAVPKQVCWNCHNQTAQIARYGETKAMHQAHVTDHKVECSSCHVQIEHSLTAGAPQITRQTDGTQHVNLDSGNCGLCHEQSHNGPQEMFRGEGGRGVPAMPSPMFRAQLDCIACHQVQKSANEIAQVMGQTFVAKQERCNYCHGEKYAGTLADWKKTVDTGLEKAEAAYATAKRNLDLSRLSGEKLLQAQRLLDDAAYNIRFVKLAHGVHNVTYSTALLTVAVNNCRQSDLIVSGKAPGGVGP